ncbi:ATP-dependent helicase [Sphingomonas sp. 3-13AW]|uniref:ATP-dependent helicase n=1 Tax=Sphingomonas sp. 3-13AW TaxID=3050450 RepID=UPI003BB70147
MATRFDDDDFVPYFDDLPPPEPAVRPSPASERAQALLVGLTAPQREAVLHRGSPLVILAGAGTGKTETMTRRIAHLIASGDARPEEILAITFTNKAAAELEERIKHKLDDELNGLSVGTFHRISGRILREHYHRFGVPEDYVILDPAETKRIIRNLAKRRWGKDVDKETIQEAEKFIEEVANDPHSMARKIGEADYDIRGIYNDYREEKRKLNSLDFNDMIQIVHDAFAGGAVVPEEVCGHWRHVVVDEYQDTNGLQYEWLRYVLGDNPNISVVGDDDQSIYGWRGAKIENILDFNRNFENAKTIKLEENFRSYKPILEAANGIIARNRNRLGKKLFTNKEPPAKANGEERDPDPVVIRYFINSDTESRWITGEIKAAIAGGMAPTDIAILSRASDPLQLIQQRLAMAGIPYVVSGGQKLQEKAEIKDALAYLRLAVNPDDGTALDRIINVPRRGVGDTYVKKILEAAELARKQGIELSLMQVVESFAKSKTFPGSTPDRVREFGEIMTKANAMFWTDASAGQMLSYLMEESGYRAALRSDLEEAQLSGDSKKAELLTNRLDSLADLEILGKTMGPTELIEQIGFADEGRGRNATGVWLGTIHAAKGLEWPVVFGIAWEENVFPSWQSLQEKGEKLAEERRCAYVEITRARETLILTTTGERNLKPASPSRFLDELPDSVIYIDNQPEYD